MSGSECGASVVTAAGSLMWQTYGECCAAVELDQAANDGDDGCGDAPCAEAAAPGCIHVVTLGSPFRQITPSAALDARVVKS